MQLRFLSRLTVAQVLAVPQKKLHFQDKRYYLTGSVTQTEFSFTVGSFSRKKKKELPRFVFAGTLGEEKGKALFTGDLTKTEESAKTDKITAFSLTAVTAALVGILLQIATGKWYYSVAAFVLGGALGMLSHFRSTKRERKAFAVFFAEYLKKIFRADPSK